MYRDSRKLVASAKAQAVVFGRKCGVGCWGGGCHFVKLHMEHCNSMAISKPTPRSQFVPQGTCSTKRHVYRHQVDISFSCVFTELADSGGIILQRDHHNKNNCSNPQRQTRYISRSRLSKHVDSRVLCRTWPLSFVGCLNRHPRLRKVLGWRQVHSALRQKSSILIICISRSKDRFPDYQSTYIPPQTLERLLDLAAHFRALLGSFAEGFGLSLVE